MGALGAFTLLWLRAAPIVRDSSFEWLISDMIAEVYKIDLIYRLWEHSYSY
jgi:hypothetical protein